MGMVKLQPSQNPNPLTDYDKTLHNWLRARDEHVTPNFSQLVVRERLTKYVKYSTKFFFIFIFPQTRLLKWPMDRFCRTMAENAISRNDVHFMGQGDVRPQLGGQISPKPSKGVFLGVFERLWTERKRMTSLASVVAASQGVGLYVITQVWTSQFEYIIILWFLFWQCCTKYT